MITNATEKTKPSASAKTKLRSTMAKANGIITSTVHRPKRSHGNHHEAIPPASVVVPATRTITREY